MRDLLAVLSRGWRLAATGFGFALFFGGGAIAAVTLFPLIRGLTANPAARNRNTQNAIHHMFRGYLRMLQALGVLRIDLAGARDLGSLKGKLIVANHPTLLDVVLLMAVIPRVQCIVKHQLWNSFYLRGVVRQAGYIRNDLEPEALVEACRAAIESGTNLIIFPQGTRTRPDASLRFHRGFANIALLAKADIQMVRITCEPLYLSKGEPWWRIPAKAPRFRVVPGECLEVATLSDRPRALAARALVRRLEVYYTGIA